MGSSAEVLVVRREDGSRRRRFVERVCDARLVGHAETVTGAGLPDTGYLVGMEVSTVRVPWVEWLNHGVAVVARFERLNHGRLVCESRRGYMLAFAEGGFVHLSVAVRYASRGEAEMFARLQDGRMLFDLAAGVQVYV